MVGMQPTDFDGAVPIDGYGPGFFRVGGQVHHGAIIVAASGMQAWVGLDDSQSLLELAGRVDILFLGMGAEIARPPEELTAKLAALGIMVEAMTTPSAARSYNVTLSEGRRVACALLAV